MAVAGTGFYFEGQANPFFPFILFPFFFFKAYGTEGVRMESRTDKVLMVTRRRWTRKGLFLGRGSGHCSGTMEQYERLRRK